LVWRHGDAERQAFSAIIASSDRTDQAGKIAAFVAEYPDSDHYDAALATKLFDEFSVKDWTGESCTARLLVASRTANAKYRLYGYTAIADVESGSISVPETDLPWQLSEVTNAVECGEAMLSEPSTIPGIEPLKHNAEAVFAKARGYVALKTKDYVGAQRQLQKAIDLKPDTAQIYLLLATAQTFGDNPDWNKVIFSLARASVLAPDVSSIKQMLTDVYYNYHGSNKGLDKVLEVARYNVNPPGSFKVDEKRAHRATAALVAEIAAAAFVGYAAYKWGNSIGTFAQSLDNSAARQAPSKVMLFGGPNHKTYLGCLTCLKGDSESVSTPGGRYGPPIGAEGIWNPVGQFGSPVSPYSACNPVAADPPVIVNEQGNYLGRLTLNRAHLQIGQGNKFYDWLRTTVCSH
jgi:hypothetical protein